MKGRPVVDPHKRYSPCRPSSDRMCIYCSYDMEGWSKLLEYDEVYQNATKRKREAESNYGFNESWDELRDQVSP